VVVKYAIPSGLRDFNVKEVQEFFANGVVEVLDASSPGLSWELSGLPAPDNMSEYTLRVSSFGPAALEDVEFRLNGHEVNVGGKFRSEVALPQEWLAGNNTLEARLKNPEGLTFVLGSVSIRVSEPNNE